MFAGATFFLVVPLIVNLVQLKRAIHHWIEDRENGIQLMHYLDRNVKEVYALAVISGSGFAAVKLLNSNFFRMSFFDMRLKNHQMTEFQNQRLFSIVLLENVPQIALQTLFAVLSDTVYPITVLALLFSALSIITSVFEYFTRKVIAEQGADYYTVYSIKYEVTSPETLKKRHTLKLQTAKINKTMGEILHVDATYVEQLQANKISGGLQLVFRFVMRSLCSTCLSVRGRNTKQKNSIIFQQNNNAQDSIWS